MPTLIINSERSQLAGFRYFWLKTVRGFRPGVHCAQCLVGDYCEAVSARMAANRKVALVYEPGTILYLCGVASPYRWSFNAHLAMEVAPGKRCSATLYTGDVVEIEGAQALAFSDAAAKERFPDRGKEFLTCRNFQFGAQYFPA